MKVETECRLVMIADDRILVEDVFFSVLAVVTKSWGSMFRWCVVCTSGSLLQLKFRM